MRNDLIAGRRLLDLALVPVSPVRAVAMLVVHVIDMIGVRLTGVAARRSVQVPVSGVRAVFIHTAQRIS